MKTEMKYTRIPFSEEEKMMLKEDATAKGMRLSVYIRNRLLEEKEYDIEFDQEKLEAHTKALNAVREELKEIYRTPMEDKILLSGFFQEMHEKMCQMESDEAKIRRDIGRIRASLQSKTTDETEEGEKLADV